MPGFFHLSYCFFATEWTNRNRIFSIFEHVLWHLSNVMNVKNFYWKTIVCETNEGTLKFLLKLTGKHLYRSIFFTKLHGRSQQLYWKETYEFSIFFLETYFIEYLQKVPSETISTKTCKLCILCMSHFSQQTRWLMGYRQYVHWWKEKSFYFIWL